MIDIVSRDIWLHKTGSLGTSLDIYGLVAVGHIPVSRETYHAVNNEIWLGLNRMIQGLNSPRNIVFGLGDFLYGVV